MHRYISICIDICIDILPCHCPESLKLMLLLGLAYHDAFHCVFVYLIDCCFHFHHFSFTVFQSLKFLAKFFFSFIFYDFSSTLLTFLSRT